MKRKSLISLLLILIGFFLNGFSFTTTLGHPTSTICLLLGLPMMLIGIILFFVSVIEK